MITAKALKYLRQAARSGQPFFLYVPTTRRRDTLTASPACPGIGRSWLPLKGHKFSLYEGGIRMPALMHWPARIPAGQVLSAPCASLDILPAMLRAAGGDPSCYELDRVDFLPYVARGKLLPERDIFWEMDQQTAVWREKWKLVLRGQFVEGAPPEDDVHLANLEDMGERVNLRDEYPNLCTELKRSVESWRTGIERRWAEEFSVERQGTVTR